MSHVRLAFCAGLAVFLIGCQGDHPETMVDDSAGGAGDSASGGAGGEDQNAAGGAPVGGANEGGMGGTTSAAGGSSVGGQAGVMMPMGGAAGAPPPEGSLPMFVAVGRGGRRIMSCDKGRTWVANQFVSTVDGEHSTFTPKGLAYGDGTFVFLSGWGNPSTTWISHDGVQWLEQKHQTGFAGLGFDNGRFVLLGGNYHEGSTDKGATWTKLTNAKANLGREAAAFDGIWAAGSDGQAQVLRKGSNTWMGLSGCTGSRHGGIGADGGFVAGMGMMLSVGAGGDICGINIEAGTPLAPSKLNATVRGKPTFTGDAFIVATGDKIHVSENGTSWIARTLPKGTTIDLVARDSSGSYAGISLDGKNFFFSDDGLTWTKATAPAGNGMVALVAGAGAPSALCKLP